jgi:hypothetical protein
MYSKETSRLCLRKITISLICVFCVACGSGLTPPQESTNSALGQDVIADVHITTNQTKSHNISLGAQLDDSLAFDKVQGLPKLTALGAQWFRIHAGADNLVLPEPMGLPTTQIWDFSALDRLVEVAWQANAKTILNVRHAPVSLATCGSFHSAQGKLKGDDFELFATYMANLVAYYNKGQFSDSTGLYVNPNGTARRIVYWEIWNEPELPYEFPCLRKGSGQASLSPGEYSIMWATVSQRMMAVDPSIQLVGPSISDPRSLTYWDLIKNQTFPPKILSTHGYLGSNAALDIELFRGGNGAIGVIGIEESLKSIIKALDSSGLTSTPIFLDEFNISPDGVDDPSQRGWGSISAALGGSLFIKMSRLSDQREMALIPFQFVEAGGQRLSSLDAKDGSTKFPYWRDFLIQQTLNTGVKLAMTKTTNDSIDAMATLNDTGSHLTILLTNIGNLQPTIGAVGESKSIRVAIEHKSNSVPKKILLRLLDSSSNPKLGPNIYTLDPKNLVDINFNGPGLATIDVTY